jgi:large subunit ribosomal protein L4
MDIAVKTIDGGDAGKLKLSDDIFGLEPREDIIARMVKYQLAKRRQGTHQAKKRSDIARTGAKMYRQKGTGNARHSSARAPQFRGGGKAFGPISRDHSHDLPKKIRALALKHALSAKLKGESLVIVDDAVATDHKTAALRGTLKKAGLINALVIGGAEIDENFARAARNIPHLDVLPVQGINVYDILRREKLVLTKAAVEALEARFKGAA